MAELRRIPPLRPTAAHRSVACILLSAVALYVLPACHAGVGPVLGYAVDRGALLGWEASGGWGPARGSVGGSYRLTHELPAETPEGGIAARETIHYLVAEPGALLGATIGRGWSEQGPGVVYGAWVGAPAPFELAGGSTPSLSRDLELYFSLATGWRFAVDTDEFYISPKVLLIDESTSITGDLTGGRPHRGWR